MKIGIFYSYGPHLKDAIKYIYNSYPNEEIIVFLPENYPVEKHLVNIGKVNIQFLPWDGSHLTMNNVLFTLPKIIRMLRKNELHILVILFESPRLIFLSKMTKAKEVYVFNVFSEYKPLQKKLLSTLFESTRRIMKGYCLYLYIYFYTKLFPIKEDDN